MSKATQKLYRKVLRTKGLLAKKELILSAKKEVIAELATHPDLVAKLARNL